MKRDMRWYDYIPINAYWFALTTRAQVLTPLIIPLLVQRFVGEGEKGTYLGIIRLWALMFALLVQALMGLLSDRSTSRWGRRRPFIVAGTLAQLAVLTLIGFAAGLTGMTGYWVLFVLYILSMFASDTAHAATQGLIPDVVPEENRGRASGVKALLELPLPLIFVSFVVAGLVSAGNLWGALLVLMVVLVVCMLITMLVRETPLDKAPFELDWRPILRLLLMVAAFTIIILGAGALVKAVMDYAAGLSEGAAQALVGIAGLLGMVVAVALGVWVSIRISIGGEAQKRPSFTWWVINRLAFLVPAINLAGFVLFFLQERYAGLEGEKAAGPAARAVMFVGIFVLLTALPAGWLADRVGKKPLILVAGLLAAGGVFLFLAVPSLTMLYVGASLIGAGAGLFYSANWALGTEIVPQEQAGRYLGISNLAGAGAGAVGAYIGGPIADHRGYVLLFAIYGALFLLSTLALVGIREAKPGEAGA
jgi:MFS family permease